MPPGLRDIHLPQQNPWENLLQPGYLGLALVFLALLPLAWWLARRRLSPYARTRRLALRRLKSLWGIGLADANALLAQLLRHKATQLPDLNRNRDQWRRLLLSHNGAMPQLAETLAFHYRKGGQVDERWLRDQLIDYIRKMR